MRVGRGVRGLSGGVTSPPTCPHSSSSRVPRYTCAPAPPAPTFPTGLVSDRRERGEEGFREEEEALKGDILEACEGGLGNICKGSEMPE